MTDDSDNAKSLVQEHDYDAAILDLNLPQADGMEVLQHFRSKRERLPILILTGRNRPEERVEALNLGADDLVLKPFSFAELSARVRALLRRGGAFAGVDAADGQSGTQPGGTCGAARGPGD